LDEISSVTFSTGMSAGVDAGTVPRGALIGRRSL
jgi:hypothetical protein